MKNNITIVGPSHPYQRQFQIALLNLEKLTYEERLLKRIKSIKKKYYNVND
jgi:hypothetical protein